MTALFDLIKMLVITAVTVVVAVVAFLYVMQDRMIFPAPQIATPASLGMGFASVRIRTPDGETLLAYHHPAEDGEATILVFHGNGDMAANQMAKGSVLAEAGFGVLLVGYRGYPGSTGTPSEQGLLIDGRASYDFIRALGSRPIGLYAHSLGTGVAVKLASERDVFALVLESPFDSLTSIAQKRFPFLPVAPLLKHKFHSDQAIGDLTAPILMMHGDRDTVIPMVHGKMLLAVAPSGTVFREVSGAGHNDLALFGTIEDALTFFKAALNQPQTGSGG